MTNVLAYLAKSSLSADELLRMYRERSGFTQSQLAEFLGLRSDRAVRKWETGYNLPQPKHLQKLLELYLQKAVFIAPNEAEEAATLWQAVKDNQAIRNEKGNGYPPFDRTWFLNLLQKWAAVNTPKPIAIDATVNIGNLPHHPARLVGRSAELTELSELVASTNLLTVVGTGGIGKTRLALAVGAALQSTFEDGVWFVELATVQEAERLSTEIATALNLRRTSGKDLTTALIQFLKARPNLLLILDNCEHLVANCAKLVKELLSACPHLKIIATSRVRLDLSGEISWRVPSLAVPPFSEEDIPIPEQVSAYPAIQLFVERARGVQANFSFNQENSLAITQICQKLDGIPLALELAAGRVNLLTVQQINQRLTERLGLLTGGSRTVLPRQQTLRALIDWSYDLLSPKEQRLFERLAVFNGSCKLEAITNVCNEENLTKKEILGLVTELVAKSLLKVELDSVASRFHLLETIREYALEKLGKPDYWYSRHLDYYLALSKNIKPQIWYEAKTKLIETLKQDYPNFRAALDFAFTDSSKATQLGLALYHFWKNNGGFSEGSLYLERLLSLIDENDVSTRAQVYLYLASLAEAQGDLEKGQEYCQTSLKLSQSLNKQVGIANTLRLLGVFAFGKGDYKVAERHLQASLQIYQTLEDKDGISGCLGNLGLIYTNQGSYDAARKCVTEAVEFCQSSGNRVGGMAHLLNLGIINLKVGDYTAAHAQFTASLHLARELDYKDLLSNALNNLGMISFDQADYKAAEAYYQESYLIHRQVSNKIGAANNLANLGNIARLQGIYEQALLYYRQSLAIAENIGHKLNIALNLNNMGNVATSQDNFELAKQYCQESLAIRQELDEKWGIASCLNNLANIAILEGDYSTAISLLEQSLRLRTEIGDKPGISSSLINLSQAKYLVGDKKEAITLLEQAWQICREIQAVMNMNQTLAILLSWLLDYPSEKELAWQLIGTVENFLTEKGVVLPLVCLQFYSKAKNYFLAEGNTLPAVSNPVEVFESALEVLAASAFSS